MYTFEIDVTYYTELPTTTVFVTRVRQGYWLQVLDHEAEYAGLAKEVLCTDMLELLDGLLEVRVRPDAEWTVSLT
jgi:hypothetical protein